jgi:T-complex protein 1 subunit theta
MDTRVLSGMVFGRAPDGAINKATDAKVAIFTCGLDIATTETKGTVLIKNAKQMMDFSNNEESQLEKVCF